MADAAATTRLSLSRAIGAYPTSTALLLASAGSLELWPGVRRLADVGGRVLVEVALPPTTDGAELPPAAATAAVQGPERTPTSFVHRFEWSGPDLPATSGVLTLTAARSGRAVPATAAELVLEVVDLEQSRLVDAPALTAMAEAFLGNLARAAEQRRRAA